MITSRYHDASLSQKECLREGFIQGSETLLTLYNVLSLASKICCTSKLRNTLQKFEAFEISRIFSNCHSNFRWNIHIQFRKCQDNSAFENSSKVRRYFVSFKKSLVFVKKWRNVSKFVEIHSLLLHSTVSKTKVRDDPLQKLWSWDGGKFKKIYIHAREKFKWE